MKKLLAAIITLLIPIQCFAFGINAIVGIPNPVNNNISALKQILPAINPAVNPATEQINKLTDKSIKKVEYIFCSLKDIFRVSLWQLHNARYYDPVLATFITGDDIVQDWYDPQSLNRYAYCRNNPINKVDPDGHLFREAYEWSMGFTSWMFGDNSRSYQPKLDLYMGCTPTHGHTVSQMLTRLCC